MRSFVPVAAAVLCLALAGAEAPEPATPRFPSSSQLVQINVSVTDKAGHGVTRLGAQDFSITDNGRAQTIAFFQSVLPVGDVAPQNPFAEPGPLAPIGRQDGGPTEAPRPSRNQEADPHSVVILLEPMGFESRHHAIKGTKEFLRQLADPGAYRVCLIDGPRVVQSFTTDIAAALRTLEEDIDSKGHPGPFDGLDIGWSFPAFDIVRALMSTPGRKTMVRFLDYGLPIYRDFFVQQSLLSNIAIYPVDARGLSVVIPFGDASTEVGNAEWTRLSPSSAGPVIAADIVERSSALFQESMLLRRIAKMTGGRALTDNNSLGRVFDLMVENHRGLYVLGYELPPGMADGRWHDVRVTVDRDDLDVHAKQRYLAPKAP